MPQYKFKVSESDGKIHDMLIEGENLDEALLRLRNRNLLPIKCLGEVNRQGGRRRFRGKKNRFDVCDFTSRLVPLLNAHIPLEKALQMLGDGNKNQQETEVLNRLRLALREGKKFSAAVREEGGLFPSLYANLLEAGEETGSLPGVVRELQTFLVARRDLKEFLVTSAIYPVMVLSVTLVVLLLMFLFFIPYFANMLVEMGRTLPLPMQILQSVSNVLIGGWWLWLLLIVVVVVGWKLTKRSVHFARRRDAFFLKLPLFGKLIEESESSRFFRTLAILMQNHVHLLTTVRIAVNVLNNQVVIDSFQSVPADLRSGAKLSAAIGKSPFAANLAIQMLQVGEESGDVGPMLNEVALLQEAKLKIKIKRLLSLFEPTVIIFLAVTILVVVLAVFMAIMEMNEV